MDTLAGIAVKYGVTVADLKRFNGLLSETDMYVRGALLVPTKLEPVGEEVAQMFAQIAAGIGRDPALHAGDLTKDDPLGRNIGVGMGVGDLLYPSTGGTDGMPWWCQCGGCSDKDISRKGGGKSD
ncbi:hypothetical protein FOA52_007052 [Chlamydomonas sp. UWO 241]|nr:hypothetical protein FOA52_007052 [Chlamydomonas sp. UWO 241]